MQKVCRARHILEKKSRFHISELNLGITCLFEFFLP